MQSDRPANPSPPASMAQVLDQIIREITTCYQPPNGVTSREDTEIWIASFGQTICDETSDPAELLAAWREFRRTFTRGFWPIPGAVAQAIRDWRAAHRPPAIPKADALPPPARGKRWSELTPTEREAFDERMNAIRAELKRTAEAARMEADLPGPKYVPMRPATPAEPMEG